MKQDLDMIKKKLRQARKLPQDTSELYILKHDIIAHWEMERHKLKKSIEYDEITLKLISS